ncbi:unnamed protein product, partial [marine sediment metagenome]
VNKGSVSASGEATDRGVSGAQKAENNNGIPIASMITPNLVRACLKNPTLITPS